MKRILAMMAAVGLLAGCEEDNSSSVVNEAPETVFNLPTNGTGTVTSIGIDGNNNTMLVYVEVSPGVYQLIDVDINGNSNMVGIVYKQPPMPPPPPPTEPATP
jgi:hypothetical protein